MFMQKIRRSTKKNRTILLIVVAILAVGIVGSFAVWNSGDYGMTNSENMTAVDVVEQYKTYLAENTPEDMESVDYDTAMSMASSYMQLAIYAGQAVNEVSSTDVEAAAEYTLLRLDSANTSAEYYQKALDEAPDSLNDAGRAALMAQLAYAQYYAANNEEARTNFDAAYALSPSASVVQSYSQFLFDVDGLAATEELLTEYMATITDKSSSEYTNIEALLEEYRMLDSLYSSTETDESETDESETDESGTATGDDTSDNVETTEPESEVGE